MNHREVSAFQVAHDDEENQAEIGALVSVNRAAMNRNGGGESRNGRRGENQQEN